MPVVKPKATSLSSLVGPQGPLTMGDRHPSMLVNIKSELGINTGQPKKVKVTVAQLDKEIFDPDFVVDFSRCGNSDTLNIHIGLRPPSDAQIEYLGDTSHSAAQNLTTDDYCREILMALKKRPELKHLEIVLELRRDNDFRVFKPCPKTTPQPQNFSLFLRHLQIEIPGLSPSNLPIWRYFMEQQTHLQTLICNFGVILWTFYSTTITNNSRTLQKIILRRIRSYDPDNSTQCNSFNWGIFANCDNLKFIKLTCVRDDVNRIVALRDPAVGSFKTKERPDDKFVHYNFPSLNMRNLEEIHVSRIKIDLKHLQWLKANAEQLKVICVDCPDKEFYDADKGDSDPWDVQVADNGNVAFDNYHFDIATVESKMNVVLCCAIVFVIALLFIALVLGIIFIYDQSRYDKNHHHPNVPNFNNKSAAGKD